MSGPWQGNPQDHTGNQGNPGYQGDQADAGFQQGGYQQGGYQQGGYQQGGYPQDGYQQGGYQQGFQQDGYQHGGFNQSSFVQNQVNHSGTNHGGFQNGYPQSGYPQAGGNFHPYGPRRPQTGLIIGIVVGVLVLIGAGVGSYFLFFKKDSTPTTVATPGGNTVINPGGNPGGNLPVNPPGGNQGSDGSATAFITAMAQAIQQHDYVSLNNATCAAERGTDADIQSLQQRLIASGVQVTVTVTSIQESGNQAVATYTLDSKNPATGETSSQQQSATILRNDAGRWIACEQALGPNDQG